MQNLPGDETITNGKPYFYIPIPVASGALALRPDAPSQLKGLRTVTVTFAYSLAPMVYLQNALQSGSEPAYSTIAFNPATDKIRIGLSTFYVNRADNRLEFLRRAAGTPTIDYFEVFSPEYSEPGKDYTFTYTMPDEAEAQEKGVNQADIEKYLEDPAFVIFNSCTSTGTSTGAQPIIIKKVVLGFSK